MFAIDTRRACKELFQSEIDRFPIIEVSTNNLETCEVGWQCIAFSGSKNQKRLSGADCHPKLKYGVRTVAVS